MATPRAPAYRVSVRRTIYAGRTSPVQIANLVASACVQTAVSGTGSIGAPSWMSGMSLYEWREIPGSAMSLTPPAVNPGRSSGGLHSKMSCWNGLCIDTRSNRVWSLANGGHDDYHGNEVMYIDFGQNAPKWVEQLASHSAAEFTLVDPIDGGTWNQRHYSNGGRTACHTYYTHQFIEARNRAVRFGNTASSQRGNSFRNVEAYNCNAALGVNGWDPSGTFPELPVAIGPGHAMCKNPTTEDVYAFLTNESVRKWTQASNTWSKVNVGNMPFSCGYAASAYDTSRNRIFLWKGVGDLHHTFDPTAGSFTAQTMSGDAYNELYASPSSTGIGMVYEPELDAYVVRLRAAGGKVYMINAATFEVTNMPVLGGATIPVTRAISGNPENIWNRFLLSPSLGGIFYFPEYSANAWFLRTR